MLRLADEVHYFVWTLPDLQLDGWPWPVVFQEVASLYNALCEKRAIQLEPCRPYGDYLAWLQRQALPASETFWRRILKGFTAPTPLPVRPTPTARSDQRVEAVEHRLPAEVTRKLDEFARQQRLTLNTLVQAAWALVLGRQSGQADVVFGAAFSGRPADLPGVESIVGPFVSNLPIRVRLQGEESVAHFLKRLQDEEFRSYPVSVLLVGTGAVVE